MYCYCYGQQNGPAKNKSFGEENDHNAIIRAECEAVKKHMIVVVDSSLLRSIMKFIHSVN